MANNCSPLKLRKKDTMDQPHNLDMVARKLAKDLVQMHQETAIELEHWGNALEFVSLYYHTTLTFSLKSKWDGPDYQPFTCEKCGIKRSALQGSGDCKVCEVCCTCGAGEPYCHPY
jgi:hypothetical protein